MQKPFVQDKDRKAASRRKKENVAPMKVRAPVLYVGFRLHFGDDGFKMSERLLDGERVHFTSDSFAGLKRRLQVVAGNFKGQRIGDGPARALFVLDPCRMRERHPDFSSADQELDIHRVGVAGSNRHDHGLINAMDLFLGPAIGRGEILKHVLIKTITDRVLCGQTVDLAYTSAYTSIPCSRRSTASLLTGSAVMKL
jgi:hypothetical protein